MPEKVRTQILCDSLAFHMVLVEGGSFNMGKSSGPEVHLSSFYIGKYPLTQDVWNEVMGKEEKRSGLTELRRPLVEVSWFDATVFCNALSERCGNEPCYFRDPDFEILYGKTSDGYKLPNKGEVYRKVDAIGYRLSTEAEWEYAARGGKDFHKRPQYEYAGGDKLDEVGWYKGNSYEETHLVGLKLANELGLYDMSGNVREWCEDWYERLPTGGKLINPRGLGKGTERVQRGGCWLDSAVGCRSTNRDSGGPSDRTFRIGFRLVLSCPPV